MTSLKGRTYEQIYGQEKAQIMREKRRSNDIEVKNKFMKLWKEYGPFSRNDLYFLHKKYGGPSAQVLKRVFGSFDGIEKECNIKLKIPDKMKNIRISKEQILRELQEVFLKNPKLIRNDIKRRSRKLGLSFGYDTIRKNFGSLDAVADMFGYRFYTEGEITKINMIENIKEFFKITPSEKQTVKEYRKFCKGKKGVDYPNFNKYFKSIYEEANKLGFFFNKNNRTIKFDLEGKNERKIIDKVEELLGIEFERQKSVYKYWVDGYNKELNLVIEVDEHHHRFRKDYDKKREKKIKEVLGCCIMRIDEQKFLKRYGGVI